MKIRLALRRLYAQKDKFWFINWIVITTLIFFWDFLFLNRPALIQISKGFLNTTVNALWVVICSLLLAWLFTTILTGLQNKKYHSLYLLVTFILNLIRSIPQIIGVLMGYVWLTYLISNETLKNSLSILAFIAILMSIFIFLELADLMTERIDHFKRLDFYNAMRVCGISEKRIINFDILWKNSRVHILNKLIAIFGMAIFLQCSVEFIISVGLSTEVSSINLPITLGSLLAKIDSKQDILAIGNTLTNPSYFSNIFFRHLQGLTVAFLIVFTLLSIYKISNGFAERHHL